MIIKTIGLIIGVIIFLAGLYYYVKEKEDAESRKIYGIASVVGVVVVIIFAVMLFLL